MIIIGCEDNVHEWNLQTTSSPLETGVIAVMDSNVVIDSLSNTKKFDDGAEIKIIAIPDFYWKFDHWEGDLVGSDNPATITMDFNKSVIAVFAPDPDNLPITSRDSVFAIIAMGQSNMVGVGDGGWDLSVDSRVLTWNTVANAWILANPSNSAAVEILHDTYIPENNNFAFHFAKQIAETYNVDVRLIFRANSGSNIGQWVENGIYSPYYSSMRTQLTASGLFEVDCILWHQGESNLLGSPDLYADSLQTLIDQLRAEPEILSNTIFIAGELLDSTTHDQRNDVYMNFRDYIEDPYAGVAELHNLQGIVTDHVHFDGRSLRIGGRERYFTAFQSMSTF